MGSGGGSASQTMEFKPPAYAQPYWEQYVKQAAALTSQAPTQYMGQRIAGMSPMTQDALDMVNQWAQNSTPDVLAGRQAVTDFASGNFVGKNPYLTNEYSDAVIADNTANMAGGFATGTAAQNAGLAGMQGAFGGSSYTLKQNADAAALAKQIGQMANQQRLAQQTLAANSYQNDRAMQLQAAGLAPAMQNLDLQASQALAGAGQAQTAYQQQILDDLYNQWQTAQQAPFASLDIMRNALAAASGGVAGGSSQTGTTSGGGMSPLAGLLGVGALGYGLYSGMK